MTHGGASEQRRRIAVALVALAGAAATLATSQATPEARLERLTSATVVLDAAAPRATARFVLTVSPEAYPLETLSGGNPSGTVRFSAGSIDRGSAPSGVPGGPVEISASLVGNPEAPRTNDGRPEWVLGELCDQGESCRAEFDVTAEWLNPQPDGSIAVTVDGSVVVSHMYTDALPSGASATWVVGAFASVAPDPTLSARADLGRLTLGLESPLAARHVVLRGSASVLEDSTPIGVTAFVRWEPSDERPQRVTVTILPDDKTDRWPLDGGALIQPFAGCPDAKQCERGFTIFARWDGIAPDDQVELDWSFEALARFQGSDGIPQAATLTATVDDSVDLGAQSPRLHAQAEGSLELQPARDTDTLFGRVTLEVVAPAFGSAFLDADPPAVAVVRLRAAALKDPTVPAGLRAFVSGGDSLGLRDVALADDGTELQTVIFPLVRCRDTPQCSGRIEFLVESRAGRDATISWQVTIDLPVPRAELAVGQLQLEVVHDP